MNMLVVKSIKILGIVIAVYTVGLFALDDPAFAHATSFELTAADSDGDRAKQDHDGACHGGSFCGGSAIICPSMASTLIDDRADRYGIPGPTPAFPAVTSCDPPPPRILI